MSTPKQLFLRHLAQTSDEPIGLEIEKAEGSYLYDPKGNKYLDLISGISVSNIGHRHPAVIKAIKDQLDKHLHLIVYGEYIQAPQVKLSSLLTAQLPTPLESVYLVNSGSEAIEGAMKLAKRYTGRSEVIYCEHAYHGSTQGALSIMGNESFKNAFRPLLPGTRQIRFNHPDDLEQVTMNTACVVIEPIQGEAGIRIPKDDYLQQLRNRCDETGTLLVLDEVQTGFGRTGKLFAFEHYQIVPDILVLAKGMGGGMPVGAFVASKDIMDSLKNNPVLGHITTFGGHPVSCAASAAMITVLLESTMIEEVAGKEELFRRSLVHPAIRETRSKGLMIAVEFENRDFNHRVISHCMEAGIITDWFLFCDNSLRIAPPLTISEDEINYACEKINSAIDKAAAT